MAILTKKSVLSFEELCQRVQDVLIHKGRDVIQVRDSTICIDAEAIAQALRDGNMNAEFVELNTSEAKDALTSLIHKGEITLGFLPDHPPTAV